MTIERKREWGFVALGIAITLFILSKTLHFSWDEGPILIKITPQDSGIATLDTPRKEGQSVQMRMQRVDFARGRMLENVQYGVLGYSTNFFIDAEVAMEVKHAGTYRFTVESDDGFRLKIDGRVVCEHPGDRPFQKSRCPLVLHKGTHHLELSYFQGGGPMGLKVTYGLMSASKRYALGQNSQEIIFERIK